MVKRLADMNDEELMGTNSASRIKHLRTRLRNAKKEKTRRSVEASRHVSRSCKLSRLAP